jgi:HD superfamily phosphohydrolase
MAAKIFRDPLYNYISVDADRDGWLLDLLGCPEVQRLRRIHQLGISNVTYPGADHSRFSHSLGVLHLCQEALRHLESVADDAQTRDGRNPLLAAALIHDIGHGPFSHLFEPCLGIKHEIWSCKIIRSEETEVNRVLRNIDSGLPERVAALVEKNNFKPAMWQKHLLDSQLDLDRLDYLRRDSLFTGSGYGHFDWYRILHTFALHGAMDKDRDLVWTDKAKYAIEEYIFARFYMYENVYLHKTTRGFEKVLQAMWTRARRLRQDGTPVSLVKPIEEFWAAQEPSVRQYLALEEHTVLSQIQAWTEHPDPTLSDLARRFLKREGFAALDAPRPPDALADTFSEWHTELTNLSRRRGYRDPECYALRDDLETRIYEAYFPEKEATEQGPVNSIRLKKGDADEPSEISEDLPRLQAVTNKPALRVRYYVPKQLREEARRLVQQSQGAGDYVI